MKRIRLTDPGHPDFARAWRLYKESFPVDERRRPEPPGESARGYRGRARRDRPVRSRHVCAWPGPCVLLPTFSPPSLQSRHPPPN